MGIFLKSGVTIREGGRFTYTFKGYGSNGLEGNLEITDVTNQLKKKKRIVNEFLQTAWGSERNQ